MINTTLHHLYIVAEVSGVITSTVVKRISVSEFREMMIDLKRIAVEKKINRLLVNATSIDFKDLKMSERSEIGLATAEILKGDFKGAYVIQKEFINRHGESLAKKHGADLLVTDNLNDAYEWLLQ